MKIELDSQPGSANRILAYGPGHIVIAERHYSMSLIVSAESVIDDWAPQNCTDLAAQHLESVVDLQPEIVVIGSGRRQYFPASEVLAPLFERNIGYEIMDTGAACRSYNVLAGEGRRVVAALMMIEAG